MQPERDGGGMGLRLGSEEGDARVVESSVCTLVDHPIPEPPQPLPKGGAFTAWIFPPPAPTDFYFNLKQSVINLPMQTT